MTPLSEFIAIAGSPRTSNRRCAHEDDGNGRCRYCEKPSVKTANHLGAKQRMEMKDWLGYMAEKQGHRVGGNNSLRGPLSVATCNLCGQEIAIRIEPGRPVKEWTITGLTKCRK